MWDFKECIDRFFSLRVRAIACMLSTMTQLGGVCMRGEVNLQLQWDATVAWKLSVFIFCHLKKSLIVFILAIFANYLSSSFVLSAYFSLTLGVALVDHLLQLSRPRCSVGRIYIWNPPRCLVHPNGVLPCLSWSSPAAATSYFQLPRALDGQMRIRGTRSKAFSRFTKAKNNFLPLARCFSWSCPNMKIASVVPRFGMKPNCMLSIEILSRIVVSMILSATFIEWSRSLWPL